MLRKWHADGVKIWYGVQTPTVVALNGSDADVHGHYVLSYGHTTSLAWNRTLHPAALVTSLRMFCFFFSFYSWFGLTRFGLVLL